jgi:hypothetical protein
MVTSTWTSLSDIITSNAGLSMTLALLSPPESLMQSPIAP